MHQKENLKKTDYKGAELFILQKLQNEVPANLHYHGYHHTLDVMQAAMEIAEEEKINKEEKKLLRIAVAFHDVGFIYVYKDHEEKGCDMAKEFLPGFGLSNDQINIICGMIMATKIPQQPKNLLEQIIADADLDYLGREDVHPIAETLFKELKIYAGITDEKIWNQVQINFLTGHTYHTNYSKNLRAPKKQQYLEELLKNEV
jgi:uncharacterized protein